MEVSRSSSRSSETVIPAAVPDEPAARAARISGFSTTELAHTLRALTPSSVGAVADALGGHSRDAHRRSAHAPHGEIRGAHPTACDAMPLVLLIAVAGPSSLAPLRARLARILEASDASVAQIRIVDAEKVAHASVRIRPNAVLTRIERHDPSAVAAIAALRDAWRVPVAATITPSIAIADVDEVVAVLDDYLVEPVRADELLIRIRCLVSRRRRVELARLPSAQSPYPPMRAASHFDSP